MTISYLRNIFLLFDLFVVLVHCSGSVVSGEAVTTRFWDCCKPSCAWKAKARFSHPVQACGKDEKPLTDITIGTGCNGGSAYACSDQQPWAINDTLSYGFAGLFIQGHVEDFWCCACYRLDFTSPLLRGKTLIVQASNTAYDIASANRFSLAIPGGNTTSHDACASQFGVDQTVFGESNSGVQSKDDCANLPESLRSGCEWRFDWFRDELYPTTKFTRIVCPKELTQKTGCIRDDDTSHAANSTIILQGSARSALPPATVGVAVAAMVITSLLSV
ncbi:endoglucanase 1 precursor [Delitschia confertaspora ATCC 74209]|uniref:cellulase n=1 Tax=Delitschia confertaspora ATCC 74209 TaxID=1513339 RepID=A0A9P4JJC0_9PLEO|nr:endoglucanase 1 precursor [Delitschia confertaspora ATCC 74209]